ncbi:MAG: HD domain-containing protein [Candidatus Omnitrophica bacterium]|nr:HD domain-containing protein [Candidatus Omnitrophota bacterium]
MLNLSSLLNKFKNKINVHPHEEGPKDNRREVGMPIEPQEPVKDEFPNEEQSQKPAPLSSHLEKRLKIVIEHTVNPLYLELGAGVKDLYSADLDKSLDAFDKVNSLLEKTVDAILADADELILESLSEYPQGQEPFYFHVANVCIISAVIGQGAGYERASLIELITAAFLHDIGMKHDKALQDSGVYSEKDFESVKKHPVIAAEILAAFRKRLGQKVIEAVLQEHERVDGSGYPMGLKDGQINEYAQIIGLADMYEACMHKRPYRAKYTSLESIKIILKNKKIFSARLVKILIEKFGIFPIGTLVRLNTKEVGVVISANQNAPARPVVNIISDSYGKELKQPKIMNLAEASVNYIDDCVKEHV